MILRGVPLTEDADAFHKALRSAIEDSLDRAANDDIHEVDAIEDLLHKDLARFVHKRLRRRPMIVPVVVEV